MTKNKPNTVSLTHTLQGLAVAAESCPEDISRIHKSILAVRAEGLESLPQVVRLAGDPATMAAIRSLMAVADARGQALARGDEDDKDEYEIDWGTVYFVGALVLIALIG